MGPRSLGHLNMQVMVFYPGEEASWFATTRPRALAVPINKLVLRRVTVHAAKLSASPDVCYYNPPVPVTNVPVLVGYKGSADTNLNYASYSYDTDASTTMGAGISYTGPYVGLSVSGNTQQSAGGSFTWPRMPGAGRLMSSQDGWSNAAYDTYSAGSENVPICGVHNQPNANNPSAGELEAHA